MCSEAARVSFTLECSHRHGKSAVAKEMAGDRGNVSLYDCAVLAIDEARGGRPFGRRFQKDQRVMTAIHLYDGDDAAEARVIFKHLTRLAGQRTGLSGGKRYEAGARGAQRLQRQGIKKRAIRHRVKAQPLIQPAGFGRGGEVGEDLIL